MDNSNSNRIQMWVKTKDHMYIKSEAAKQGDSIMDFVTRLVEMWRQAEEIQILYEVEPPPMNE